MTDQLQQINISFVPVEDRLLLRMTAGKPGGLSEYRVWLTRRFVRLLWSTLEQMMELEMKKNPSISPESRQVVRQFQEDAALKNTDFSTPFQDEQPSSLPLGDAPILASLIQSGHGHDGQQVLCIKDQRNQGINITLNLQLIHSVRKLINDAVRLAQWDLNIAQNEGLTPIDQFPRTIN